MEQLVTKPLWRLLLSAALRANVSSMFPPSTPNMLVQRANCCVNGWLGWLIHTLMTDLCFRCLPPCIWNEEVNCKFLFWLNVCGGVCGPHIYICLQGNCSVTFKRVYYCWSYACCLPKDTKLWSSRMQRKRNSSLNKLMHLKLPLDSSQWAASSSYYHKIALLSASKRIK